MASIGQLARPVLCVRGLSESEGGQEPRSAASFTVWARAGSGAGAGAMFGNAARAAARGLGACRGFASNVEAKAAGDVREFVARKYSRRWTDLYPELKPDMNADEKRPTGMIVATAVKDLVLIGLAGIVINSQLFPPS